MECIHLQINKIAEKIEKKKGYGAVFSSVARAWLGSAEPWLWSPGKQAEWQ